MNSLAKEELEALIVEDLQKKHPNIPQHAIPKPKLKLNTSNGLTRAIIKYIQLSGGMAERVSNTGRFLQPKTYTTVFGNKVQLKPGKWIPGTGRNGTADISVVFKGIPLAVEVKIGKDRQSDAQKAYQEEFERVGGLYILVTSFEQFHREFNEKMK